MSHVSQRPLVGIPSATQYLQSINTTFYRFNANYTAALAAAGAVPVAIPLELPADILRDLFERLDGLLLAGGFDVEPARYDEEPHPSVEEIDPARDGTEVTLARWALQADLPLLGVCRGIQMLNVAAGGSLWQDLRDQVPGTLAHKQELIKVPWERTVHPVRIEAGSRLAKSLGATELNANSFHHQAVKDVAPGFVPVAWAPDQVIEGIEDRAKRFAMAVQWHPEGMYRTDPRARELFASFVAAARNGR